jgi:hypothetical protein
MDDDTKAQAAKWRQSILFTVTKHKKHAKTQT